MLKLACIMKSNFMHFIEQRILSSGGLFSVESMPGKAAATRRNNYNFMFGNR